MLSSNLAIFKLTLVASLSITALGVSHAQLAPVPPGPTPAQAQTPASPSGDKTKAPQAPGATRQSNDADTVSGMTLGEFANLERKRALDRLRKEIKDAQEPEKKEAAPPPPQGLPNITQFPPGFKPGMPMPAGMTPAMLARLGPGAAGMFAPPGPKHKVVSIVSFRGDVSADVIDGELVTTVRVGDRLGTGKVASIDVGRGVSIESPGTKGAPTITVLPPATNMEPQVPSLPQFGGMPEIPGMAPNPALPADATSVPMVILPPQGQRR